LAAQAGKILQFESASMRREAIDCDCERCRQGFASNSRPSVRRTFERLLVKFFQRLEIG
jgi:hypothetical protein